MEGLSTALEDGSNDAAPIKKAPYEALSILRSLRQDQSRGERGPARALDGARLARRSKCVKS
jgi:hypothetical protein